MEDWVAHWARERPDQGAAGGLTYAELDQAVGRAARRLAGLGVGEGDRVATTLPAGPDFAALLHAVPRVGAVFVPLASDAARSFDASLVVAAPLEGDEEDVEPRVELDPSAVHSALLTSGTSGEAKTVELTLANHVASAAASAWHLGVAPDDRWLCPLPLFHVGGLAVLMRSALYGTTVLLHDGFDVEQVKDSLESGEATLVSLVPTMLRRLREAGLSSAPALRAALLGGGPVPLDLLEWARGAGLPVMATYGMTETASQVATAAPWEPAAAPLPGVQLRISEAGEILVRGPMVSRGALAGDGWLHTGDLGELDESGLLTVYGRSKDLIVSGGENVAPAEVERVLVEHPDLSDAAVVGISDEEWGEAVTAFVVLRTGVDEPDLAAWCRERLAPFKVPKRFAVVDELPRNAAGKILKQTLREGRPGRP